MYKIQSDINRLYKTIYWYTEYSTIEKFVDMHMSYTGEAYSYYNKYYIGFYNSRSSYAMNLLFNVTLFVAFSDGHVDGELGNFGSHEDLDKSFASSLIFLNIMWIATTTLLYMIEKKDLDFDDTYIFISLI